MAAHYNNYLVWPSAEARTPHEERKSSGRFKRDLKAALAAIETHLELLEAQGVFISADWQVGIRGVSEKKGADVGVVVAFDMTGLPYCFAMDRYDSLRANAVALAIVLEKLQGILLHTDLQFAGRMMEGFSTALAVRSAPRLEAGLKWWQILGVEEDATADDMKAAHRALVKSLHSDVGGYDDHMATINQAYQKGLKHFDTKR